MPTVPESAVAERQSESVVELLQAVPLARLAYVCGESRVVPFPSLSSRHPSDGSQSKFYGALQIKLEHEDQNRQLPRKLQ